MEATGWTLLMLLSKVLIYLAGACVAGGLFALWMLRRHNRHRQWVRYLRAAALLGVFATMMHFLAQVGSFADEGIAGMWNQQIFMILLDSGVGEAALARVFGFALMVMAGTGLLSSRRWLFRCAWFLVFAGCAALLWSYTPVGHLSEKSWLGRDLLVLHLLGISLWLGSLYPLWCICGGDKGPDTQDSLRRFGQMAAVFVSMLLACGLCMAFMLLANPEALFATPYGRILLIKLMLVGGLLGLAASNLFWQVPRFQQPHVPQRLRRVITAEALLGLAALVATGVMTTYVGPSL